MLVRLEGLEALEETVEATLFLLFAEGGTLVVLVLTSTEGNIEFCASVVIDEESKWYDGESGSLTIVVDVAYLFAVEQ